MSKKIFQTLDGNTIASLCSYNFVEVVAIYPITPSSTMAENVDIFASKGKKNFFGSSVKVVEMQSEGGVAGAIHGALQSGALAATYTSSQGLLLMIPNIYKMVGECLPAVIHVATRSIAARSLSIFGDHQDIYAIRQTGAIMLCSHSVQEIADLANVAHLIAIDASLPVCHFFDGFRTSHEIQNVEFLPEEEIKKIIPFDKIKQFRDKALNPHFNPVTRGGAENEDIYFQGKEAQNSYFNNAIKVAEKYLNKFSILTGRKYAPFVYYGSEKAEFVIIAMGSVTECIKEVIDNDSNGKLGLIKVHLYRPFSAKHLINVLPVTVKRIAVLDRTKESGSIGEPLYLDVVASLSQEKIKNIEVFGGRYGLSNKDIQPKHIKAVFDFIKTEKPWNSFTVGINDDVTKLSIPVDDTFSIKNNYTSCLFYGLGGDGTVSANKSSIKIISDATHQYVQAYFQYDSRKSGNVTRSHLRFGNDPIKSTYFIQNADFISCSLDTYIFKYDIIKNLKDGGIFLLNTNLSDEVLIKSMPERMKFSLATKHANMFVIDANKIASKIGLGRHTNMILQSSFFFLNKKIMPYEDAKKMIREFAKKMYFSKGEEIVKMNFEAIESGVNGLRKIKIDDNWKLLKPTRVIKKSGDEYFDDYVNVINSLDGNDIPTSIFLKHDILDGTLKNNISFREKKNIADRVPLWDKKACLQCNQCVFVCPHAVIRPFLLNKKESEDAPDIVKKNLIKAIGKSDYNYVLQISSKNCVGCGLCVAECLANKTKKEALKMVDAKTQIEQEIGADYLFKSHFYNKKNLFSSDNVKDVGFLMPYMEVSGACAGCGETPYYELISRLFGKDALIANATGCSSIYNSSVPVTPFCTDKEGNGIAWGNSLLEDNAEYGFGMRLATDYKLNHIISILNSYKHNCEKDLIDKINEYIANIKNREKSRLIVKDLVYLLKKSNCQEIKEVLQYQNDFIDKSIWIIGGDGWAYDIGYGGLDHILASNADVNILVLDTELYSNTGGQSSKSTQIGAVAKFASSGKTTEKKNLALMAMSYGHVYVAQIAMSNPLKTIQVLKEAEKYQGPSLIICYAPCVAHGIKGGMFNSINNERAAVECGYFVPFHFNPNNLNSNAPTVILDSKEPDFTKFKDFLINETRFSQLLKINKENAEKLFASCEESAKNRFTKIKNFNLK